MPGLVGERALGTATLTRELQDVGYFKDCDEVEKYIGKMFILAGEHPEVGEQMRGAGIVVRLDFTDPDCQMNVVFGDPMQVSMGPSELEPDITLSWTADIADRFWRGEYNLTVGLAKRKVKAKGQISQITKLAPLTKPLYPIYREIIAEKDAVERT